MCCECGVSGIVLGVGVVKTRLQFLLEMRRLREDSELLTRRMAEVSAEISRIRGQLNAHRGASPATDEDFEMAPARKVK